MTLEVRSFLQEAAAICKNLKIFVWDWFVRLSLSPLERGPFVKNIHDRAVGYAACVGASITGTHKGQHMNLMLHF